MVLCCPPVAVVVGGGAGGLVLGVSVAGAVGGCADPVEDDEAQGAEHDQDPTDEEDGGLERERGMSLCPTRLYHHMTCVIIF